MEFKKKTKQRKALFYLLSKYLRENRKKSKPRKGWLKNHFREKNKGKYDQMLQNTRVSDKEDHFSYNEYLNCKFS